MKLFVVPLALLVSSAALSPTLAAPPASPAKPAATALKPWKVDLSTSRLTFKGKQTGRPFEGRFQKFAPTILFDPANLGASSIVVVVDMTSAKTGDAQRDAALPTADWFETKKFPTAKFVSTKIVAKDSGYEASGNLTIRDVTVPVTLPFAVNFTGDYATARGTTTLQRQAFGVGRGEFANDKWVGFDVAVSFVVNAEKAR